MKKHIEAEEQIIYECKPHWSVMIAPTLLFIFFFLLFITALIDPENRSISFIFLIMGIISFGVLYLNVKASHLVLTDKRIYGKRGIINTSTLSSPISKIQTVNIHTTLCGRIFGYGNLVIHCITGVYRFNTMANAEEMQNAILNTISN